MPFRKLTHTAFFRPSVHPTKPALLRVPLVNVFTIRQTSQSHPAVAEEVNHGIQQVKLCWESTLHPGYVSLADLHSALYLNALEGGDSN